MAKLLINDLSVSEDLDHQAMATVRGGFLSSSENPFANVNIDIVQNLSQVQYLDLDILNHSIIGPGFGPFSLDLDVSQYGALETGIG